MFLQSKSNFFFGLLIFYKGYKGDYGDKGDKGDAAALNVSYIAFNNPPWSPNQPSDVSPFSVDTINFHGWNNTVANSPTGTAEVTIHGVHSVSYTHLTLPTSDLV